MSESPKTPNGEFQAPLQLRLVRLHVEGFGRLRDFTFEPARRPGALIVAPNEAGKSTLAAALFHGLFGFSDKAQEEARRPWAGGPFRLTMEWELSDGTACTILRDFKTQDVVVEWTVDGVLDRRWEGQPNPRGRSSDRGAYDGELRRLMGFVSWDIFRQTAFVGPGDPGTRPLAAELLRLLSGSERADFRAALAEFEARYYDLTQDDIHDSLRKAKHKPRRLETLGARRLDLTHRRQQAIEIRGARRGKRRALGSVREGLAEVEREIEEQDGVREAISRMRRIREEIATAESRRSELEGDVERFVDWERRVREKTSELEPDVRYLRLAGDFPDRIRNLQGLIEDIAEAKKKGMSHQQSLAEQPGAGGTVIAVAAGAVLAVTGSVLRVLGAAVPAGEIVAGLGAVVLAYGGWRLWSRRAAARRWLVQWAGLQSEVVRMETEQRALTESLAFRLDTTDLEGELGRYERARQLRSELDGMKQAREALGDRQAVERELRSIKEEKLDVLRLERRRILEKHPYLEFGPDYERQFVHEQERYREEAERLRAEELALRRALADLPAAGDDPHRLEEELEAIREEIERLELDRDAFRLAFEVLTDCRNEFVQLMTQRLQRRVGGVFESITDGRYSEVEIDPESLELTVHGVEKRDVPAESLSRGTRDQLYFALRVALLEEMASNRALPVVLDDPFLHFDRKRLSQVETTLERLGETHQILLFTHDTRLAAWTFPKQWLPELEAHSKVEAPTD